MKLTEIISHILGTSGRAVLRGLIAGETDPRRLADLTSGRLKASRAQLVDALEGRVTGHHRFMLQLHLTQIEPLETAVHDLETRISDALAPFRAAVSLVTTMPVVKATSSFRLRWSRSAYSFRPTPTSAHCWSPGRHTRPSLILFRHGSPRRPSEQTKALIENLPTFSEDLTRGAIVVFRRNKIRIRKLFEQG